MVDLASSPVSARALVIEDHPATRRFFRAHLKHIGWDVAEASNAAEGLKAFKQFQPQVITLDLNMVNVDGLTSMDFLRTVREIAPGTAIFVVSGVACYEQRQSCLRAGARDFFLKPVVSVDAFETLFTEIQNVREARAA